MDEAPVWEHTDHSLCESETIFQQGTMLMCGAHNQEVLAR